MYSHSSLVLIHISPYSCTVRVESVTKNKPQTTVYVVRLRIMSHMFPWDISVMAQLPSKAHFISFWGILWSPQTHFKDQLSNLLKWHFAERFANNWNNFPELLLFIEMHGNHTSSACFLLTSYDQELIVQQAVQICSKEFWSISVWLQTAFSQPYPFLCLP